jgi:Zn-dependent peptidase ImmA (M78 family)
MKHRGILRVEDLEVEHVATAFNVAIIPHPTRNKCHYEDDFAIIELKKGQSLRRMRKAFFHELAHVVSHYGNQRKMTREFLDLQESQAECFSLYLSMPRHIFEPLLIKHQCLETLEDLFELPSKMIIDRIESVRRERKRSSVQMKFHRNELMRRNKSLQPGNIYDSTIEVLNQLEKQVGKDKLNEHTKSLLREY